MSDPVSALDRRTNPPGFFSLNCWPLPHIKLNMMNSVTALRNARAEYDTSVVARQLQDETLAGTRRKYELGTATILDVVIAQRDDTTRQLSEADARNSISVRARTWSRP